MPRQPKRPCSYPGCPKLVEGQYCDEHKRLTDKQYNQYGRDEFTKNFYKTPEWRTARKQQLNSYPFCEECLKAGKRTKATMVDHIKPIKQGGDKVTSKACVGVATAESQLKRVADSVENNV